MRVTATTVAATHERTIERAPTVVSLINEVRADLGDAFDTEVASVTVEDYRGEVHTVFADGDRAVNVAALLDILEDLDVENDHPGFVVDELLGRELAGMIAGPQPLRLLGEATFHYADVSTHVDGPAGADDALAALAAGFQTRLPGWTWKERSSPFAVD